MGFSLLLCLGRNVLLEGRAPFGIGYHGHIVAVKLKCFEEGIEAQLWSRSDVHDSD